MAVGSLCVVKVGKAECNGHTLGIGNLLKAKYSVVSFHVVC